MPENLPPDVTRVAVIPARGGSKRIPRKNIRDFLGKPMISWPLEALKESGLFQNLVVSTDDREIANLAESYGARIHKRDAELADDFSSTGEVLTAVLRDLLQGDQSDPWIYKIYPTAPISASDLLAFVNFTESSSSGLTVGVKRSRLPVQRALRLTTEQELIFREPEFAKTRSQDLEPLFFDAGKMYSGRKSDWLSRSWGYVDSFRGFSLPEWLAVDVDTEEDWLLAEDIMGRHLRGLK